MERLKILIDENRKHFENWESFARKVCKAIKLKLNDPEARVIVFGGVVKGTWNPAFSDIDILIVSDKVVDDPLWRAKTSIWLRNEAIEDAFAPFQFHYVTKEKFEGWYRKFVDVMYEIYC